MLMCRDMQLQGERSDGGYVGEARAMAAKPPSNPLTTEQVMKQLEVNILCC